MLDEVAKKEKVRVTEADIDGGKMLIGGGGIIQAPAEYWQELRALCDRYGVLWVADEVSRAFWGACHGGQRACAEYLLERGAETGGSILLDGEELLGRPESEMCAVRGRDSWRRRTSTTVRLAPGVRKREPVEPTAGGVRGMKLKAGDRFALSLDEFPVDTEITLHDEQQVDERHHQHRDRKEQRQQ